MKSKEEIIRDVMKLEVPTNDYNLIEIFCFLSIKQTLIMFENNQIDKERATLLKENILKEYEIEKEMFQDWRTNE